MPGVDNAGLETESGGDAKKELVIDAGRLDDDEQIRVAARLCAFPYDLHRAEVIGSVRLAISHSAAAPGPDNGRHIRLSL
jgi:hypothetical protein